ncbi:MAG: magnesium transporter [Balneolaceae bacterium]|nr:MAG: magnesium transporter [Balneolaceae bacterium]
MTIQNYDINPFLRALKDQDMDKLKFLIANLNPATLAELLAEIDSTDHKTIFLLLNTEDQADIMKYLDFDTQIGLIHSLDQGDIKNLVEAMPHDTRVDLLNRLPSDERKDILRHLAKVERDDILQLSKFEEGTVGSIMTSDYAILHPDQSAHQAIEKLRVEAPDHEMIYYAYVVDKERKLIGTVSMRALIISDPSTKISEILTSDVEKVNVNEPEEIASRKLKQLDLLALPVVDDNDRLVGMITFDDAMQAIEEDVSDTMYQKAGVMTGTSSRDKARDVLFSKRLTQGNILYPVKLRITFLFVTLIGGFLVGGVIDRFEELLSAIIVAAVFIPVIMDMGGNVGTQSTTIFARGLALGHIKLENIYKHIGREMAIGAMIGLILGVLAGTGAYFWQGLPNDLPQIGLAVGLSLMIVLPLASFLGFFIPYMLLKMGWDHAPGADPFITTIKDFVGLTLYFSLVSVMIGI